MAFSHTIKKSLDVYGTTLTTQKTYSGSGNADISEAVADGQTDTLINIAIDVSAVKSFFLLSDQDVTIETNSGSEATNTLALKAGVPYEWTPDSYDTFKLTGDVTKYYVTNASGATANIEQRCIQDLTP